MDSAMPHRPKAPDHPDLKLKPVVVITTCENVSTVLGLVEGLLSEGWRCVAVDDTGGDKTYELLCSIASQPGGELLDVIRHEHPRGKAEALASGFARARSLDASHAITLDPNTPPGPGQIGELWSFAMRHPQSIVLAQRPGDATRCTRSRIATALIRLQCGINIVDPHSSLRVYPLAQLDQLGGKSSRVAFETEMIVRAIRTGIEVTEYQMQGPSESGPERASLYSAIRDTVQSIAMHAVLFSEHPFVVKNVTRWLKRQLLYLPLFGFLLVGALRSGLGPEAQWHPALLTGSALGLVVLVLWRRLGLGYEPVPAACLIFLFVGAGGVLSQGTALYPLIHESYGSLQAIALLLWIAAVCVVLAFTRPAWLLGSDTLPHAGARYHAWGIAGASVTAVFIGLALRSTSAALVGMVPFIVILIAQGVLRRTSRS